MWLKTLCPPFVYSDNILVLDIYFEALNYETIEQKKAYELAGLLGKEMVFTGTDNIQNVTWPMLFIQSDSNASACGFKISVVVPEDTVLSL